MPTADASGTPSQPLVEARQRDTTEPYRADTGKRGVDSEFVIDPLRHTDLPVTVNRIVY